MTAGADEEKEAAPKGPKTNDTLKLVPNTKPREPKIEFDWPALHIGAAWYEEGPTGCTVFYFPDQAKTVADLRGGNHASSLRGQPGKWTERLSRRHLLCGRLGPRS